MIASLSRMFYGHMICLLKFPYYLYLDPIVCLDIVNQIFKCVGDYFLLGALITCPFGVGLVIEDYIGGAIHVVHWYGVCEGDQSRALQEIPQRIR